MKLAIITPVHPRDEALKEPFLGGIREVYPDAPHFFAGDDNLPRRPDVLVRRMIEVAEETGAEWVVKSDVDVLHRSELWLAPGKRKLNPPAGIGFQHRANPGGFGGPVYAVRADILPEIQPLILIIAPRWKGAEDLTIAMGVRLVAPNGVYLYPARSRAELAGVDLRDYEPENDNEGGGDGA